MLAIKWAPADDTQTCCMGPTLNYILILNFFHGWLIPDSGVVYYHYYYYTLSEFFTSALTGEFFVVVVFLFFFTEVNSPQISRTFLSILTDFSTAMAWMVSILLLISSSLSLFSKPLESVPKAQTTIVIIVSMFHNCFLVNWQNPRICLSFHFFYFFLLCGPLERQNSPDDKFFFIVN